MNRVIFIKIDENQTVNYRYLNHKEYMQIYNKTLEELLSEGYLIESIPEPQKIEGKVPVLMWDGSNVYYRYDDLTTTTEDEITKLKEKVDTQDQVIEEILYTILPDIVGGGK